jgi:hypothetical protein
MKRFLVPAALALTTVLLGACVDEPPKRPAKKSGFHPPTPTTDPALTEVPPEQQPPPTPDGTKPTTTDVKPPPAVPEQPVPKGEIPYAKPVPGKPGFVFSPYDQYKGYIDVRGFPPGTEVKDPYSGKSFLVP